MGILEAIDSAIWSNAEMQAKLMHNSQQHPRAGRYKGMRGAAASFRIVPEACSLQEPLDCLHCNFVVAMKLGIVQLPSYGEIMYQLLQTQASVRVSMQLKEDMFVGNMRG